MSILKVARMGHPVLRRKAEEIPPNQITGPEVQGLIDDMFATMDEYGGIGLAAPQVHRSLSLMVHDSIPDPDNEGQMIAARDAVINPVITPLTKEEISIFEGCLSVPEIRGRVPRASRIRLTCLNRRGEKVERELHGLASIVFQHEIDHLNGVLFVDRMRDFSTLSFEEEYRKHWVEDPESI